MHAGRLFLKQNLRSGLLRSVAVEEIADPIAAANRRWMTLEASALDKNTGKPQFSNGNGH